MNEGKKEESSKGVKGSPEYFVGTVWVKTLASDNEQMHCTVLDVTFEPGARNNWHKHPGGQVLIVTEGTGYYQEKGKPIQLLHKGDAVTILPDVEHWHGASPDSVFTHIAINPNLEKGAAEWLQPVSEEEYNSFK